MPAKYIVQYTIGRKIQETRITTDRARFEYLKNRAVRLGRLVRASRLSDASIYRLMVGRD